MPHKSMPALKEFLQIAFLVVTVAIVLSQANPLDQIPNRDSGFFMYTGNQILKGRLLYVDIWDSKGPLIFYINALALLIGCGSRWGVWSIEFVFLFFSTHFGLSMMKKMWGLLPALVGTSIWLLAFNNAARGGNYTEEYSLLFNFAALYLFWRNLREEPKRLYDFIIGATLAISSLFRANNIGVQLSIILVMIASAWLDKKYSQNLKRLIWIAAGSLSVFILVGVYFQILGILDDMIQASLIYNYFYSHGGTRLDNLAKSFTRGIDVLGYLSVMLGILGLIVALDSLPKAMRAESKAERNLFFLLLVGWPIEVMMSGLSGNNYSHYYICWSPYLGLLGGLLIYSLAPAFNELSDRRPLETLFIVLALVCISSLDALRQYGASFARIFRGADIELVDPVAAYIRDNTNPDDTALIWGIQPYINLMAQRDAPTSVLFYPVLAQSPLSDELNSKFYQDLVENKPAVIADMVNPNNDTIPFIDPVQRENQPRRMKNFIPPHNLEQVFSFIHSNYHIETKIGGVAIYRLNNGTP